MEEGGDFKDSEDPTNHREFLCVVSPTVKVLGAEPSPQLSLSSREASLCSFLSSLRKEAVFTQESSWTEG